MASPVEIMQNLPDTLPADFEEWDSEGAQSPASAEKPAIEPRDSSSTETPQREFARREAEAVDLANHPYAAREASRDFEVESNVTQFSDVDAESTIPRGFPAPVVRAPRTASSPSLAAVHPLKDESAFLNRVKSLDTVVDKLPADHSNTPESAASTVPVLEFKPNKPLFSSLEVEEPEISPVEESSIPLNDLLEDAEERRARRKWIMSACIFGGSMLLVGFQLFHYGTAGRLKGMVAPRQAVTASADPYPEADPFSHQEPATARSSQVKIPSSMHSQAIENSSSNASDSKATPAPVQRQMMQAQLMAPTRLPQSVKTITTNDTTPPASLAGASIAALSGNNMGGGNVFAERSNTSVSGPKVVAVSAGVAAGNLIRKTQPVYPAIARSARVQGAVILQATISRTGAVTNLKVVSGPPMLRQAAIDAVKTWQYKPYLLNNQPTDVDTTVQVVFSLGE